MRMNSNSKIKEKGKIKIFNSIFGTSGQRFGVCPPEFGLIEDSVVQTSPLTTHSENVFNASGALQKSRNWLLHGEVVRFKFRKVGYGYSNGVLIGNLFFTNYRIKFVTIPSGSMRNNPIIRRQFNSPLTCILSIEEKFEPFPQVSTMNEVGKKIISGVKIKCKDFQVMNIFFLEGSTVVNRDPSNTQVVLPEEFTSLSSSQNSFVNGGVVASSIQGGNDRSVGKYLIKLVDDYLSTDKINKVFAFSFARSVFKLVENQESKNNQKLQAIPESYYDFGTFPITMESLESGWKVYDFKKEYQRMGCKIYKSEQTIKRINGWRFFHNKNYEFCRSYPEYWIVPSNITDTQIENVVKFRSRGRIPVMTWKNHFDNENSACLLRCAQPFSGIKRNYDRDDEALVNSIVSISNSSSLCIVDLRSKTNAWGNTLMGKGYENLTNYQNSTLEFMGIDNIHSMSASYKQLQRAIFIGQSESEGYESFDDKYWFSSLESSGWINHTSVILASCKNIVFKLKKNITCLVHCSDGWDRTAQICALVQLLIDPYFRSVKGFIMLIEKEWISFRHQFRDRCGFLINGDKVSPIFLQFMDCVWNIWAQFPEQFEFNENFLLTVLHHAYSGLFGNFLSNEYDEGIEKNTLSLWSFLLIESEKGKGSDNVFKNFLFNPQKVRRTLLPKTDFKTLDENFWRNFYLRNTSYTERKKNNETFQLKDLVQKQSNIIKNLHKELRKERKKSTKLEEKIGKLYEMINESKTNKLLEGHYNSNSNKNRNNKTSGSSGDREFSHFFEDRKLNIVENYFGEESDELSPIQEYRNSKQNKKKKSESEDNIEVFDIDHYELKEK